MYVSFEFYNDPHVEEETPEFSVSERLFMENEVAGMYLSGHPLNEYDEYAKIARTDRIGSIISMESDSSYKDGQTVRVLAIVSKVKTQVTKNNKMMAFVTSAALAGMAGALYGLNISSVTAAKFKFDTSILVLVFVVLGGIGSIRGSVIAATLLTILPEMLRAFADYRMLVYAIVLILVMLATNNPQVRQLVQRIIPKRKNPKKEGETA